MPPEKRKAFIINFVYFILIAGIIYFLCKKVVPLYLPFIVGGLIAVILAPFIRWLADRTRLNKKAVAIVVLLCFYALITVILLASGGKIGSMVENSARKLPAYYQNEIVPQVSILFDKVYAALPDYQEEILKMVSSLENSIHDIVMGISSRIISVGASAVVSFPSLLINLIFAIVSSFFLTMDLEVVKGFVLRQLPDKKRKMLTEVTGSARVMTFKIIRVYALMMSITFVELSVGFLIMRLPSPFLLAFLIAVVDILPVLGTGTVLIPWSLVLFIIGNPAMGAGILVLYVVITAVRQTLEPKIIGQQVGLHPIVTLLCIFTGAQLLGVIGIFLLPIIATVIKKMNDEGTIQLFR